MQKFSNLLIIAGTGRNTGKTTLACEIIQKISNSHRVIGLKISPHFHGGTDSLKIIASPGQYNIFEETSAYSAKDSSKMLAAGAGKVYYIETFDENILEAFTELMKSISKESPIVCESPVLQKVVKPGIFMIVDNISQTNKKQDVLQRKDQADFFIETDKTEIDKIVQNISFTSAGWRIK